MDYDETIARGLELIERLETMQLWSFKDLMARTGRDNMRSKETQNKVEVIKRVNLGKIPLFLQLAHKGLEKTNPDGTVEPTGGVKFNVAKDLIALSVTKPELLENVESVELVYQKPTSQTFGGRQDA